MLTLPSTKRRIATALLVYSLVGASFANSTSLLPPIQHSGTHTYLTGGIGLDESSAFKNASKDWPLSLQFAEKDGMRAHYVADVHVRVTDAKSQVAIRAKSDGPFMLIKVPAGVYKIDATLAGKTLHQKVEVKDGQPGKATFLWPANTGETR